MNADIPCIAHHDHQPSLAISPKPGTTLGGSRSDRAGGSCRGGQFSSLHCPPGTPHCRTKKTVITTWTLRYKTKDNEPLAIVFYSAASVYPTMYPPTDPACTSWRRTRTAAWTTDLSHPAGLTPTDEQPGCPSTNNHKLHTAAMRSLPVETQRGPRTLRLHLGAAHFLSTPFENNTHHTLPVGRYRAPASTSVMGLAW